MSAAVLALAVIALLTLFAGPAPAEAAPTAGTVAAGHAHHPQAVPLRLPDKHLKQHRRAMPAGMVAGTATAVVPLPPGRTGTGTRPIRSAATRPRGRAPPR